MNNHTNNLFYLINIKYQTYKFFDLLLLFYKKNKFFHCRNHYMYIHNPECFTLYTGWYATNV